MKGAPLLYALIAACVGAGGIVLHRRADLNPATIASCVHVAALVGVAACIFVGASTTRTRRAWARAALAAYLGWRVAFFPVLVLSGHAAAISEWTVRFLHGNAWTVCPMLLLAMATGTAITVRLVHATLGAGSWRRRVICGAPCIAAGLISFTAPSDLDLLPDRTPWSNTPTPEASPPLGNAYQHALDAGLVGAAQRPLVIAASLTYETIPCAPWASHVQGTLELAFRGHPKASSMDRVREHFQAFAAAHRFARR